MKVRIGEYRPHSGTAVITLYREDGDRKYRDSHTGWTSTGASGLLYNLRKLLIAAGFDVIKKRMSADGHMVDDHEHYLRSRQTKTKRDHHPDHPTFFIHDPVYAIRGCNEPWNEEGRVDLEMGFDIFGPECRDMASCADSFNQQHYTAIVERLKRSGSWKWLDSDPVDMEKLERVGAALGVEPDMQG